MELSGLIARAYWLPIRHFGAVLKIFWPALLVMLLAAVINDRLLYFANQSWFEAKSDDEIGSFADIVHSALLYLLFGVTFAVLTTYQSIVLASGLIHWHRYLIEGANPQRARLWLGADEWRFYGQWFVLGLAGFIISAVFLWSWWALSTLYPSVGPMRAWLVSYTAVLAYEQFWLPGAVAICLLWPRTLLSLAAIAVGRDAEFASEVKPRLTVGRSVALSIAMLAIIFPSALIKAQVNRAVWHAGLNDISNDSISLEYAMTTIGSHLAAQLSIIVFATLLSSIYRLWFVDEANGK